MRPRRPTRVPKEVRHLPGVAPFPRGEPGAEVPATQFTAWHHGHANLLVLPRKGKFCTFMNKIAQTKAVPAPHPQLKYPAQRLFLRAPPCEGDGGTVTPHSGADHPATPSGGRPLAHGAGGPSKQKGARASPQRPRGTGPEQACWALFLPPRSHRLTGTSVNRKDGGKVCELPTLWRCKVPGLQPYAHTAGVPRGHHSVGPAPPRCLVATRRGKNTSQATF